MRKTVYKKIRLGGIILCLILMTAALIPTVAFAADNKTTVEQDSVHFINPTAISIVGDCLYVADIIENGKTALLCFDLKSGTPTLKYTYEIDEEVNKLSNADNCLYAISGSKVLKLALSDGLPTVDKTYSFDNNVAGIVLGTFGQNKVEFALTNRLLRYNSASNTFAYASENTLANAKGCATLGDIVFYVYKNDSSFVCGGFNGNVNSMSFLTNFVTITTEPIGITTYKNNVVFYSQHSIMYVNDITMGYWTNNQTMQGNALENLIADTGDKTILDVAIKDETIFVLNESINKIDMYENGDNGYTVAYTIGSDMVDKDVPTAYTGFTLVRPNGYPANIVYKTNAETSVDDIITDASEYVIIDYEGSESSHYYYVMVGDKFGWVKKSDDATNPAQDKKLNIVNNNLGDGVFEHETEFKFTTLNGVFVHELPLENSKYDTVTQTASKMKTVKVMQEYKDGDTVWYYISYDDGKTGFVKKSDVGQLHITSKVDKVVSEGLRKINSSLFSPVNLYATADMNEGDYVANVDGNVIKLYSGDRVTLVKTEGDVAFVMVLHSNGNQDFGWLEASRLIGVHAITTNAIVGLSLLAVAIALTTVLLIVYFKRRKRIKRNNA